MVLPVPGFQSHVYASDSQSYVCNPHRALDVTSPLLSMKSLQLNVTKTPLLMPSTQFSPPPRRPHLILAHGHLTGFKGKSESHIWFLVFASPSNSSEVPVTLLLKRIPSLSTPVYLHGPSLHCPLPGPRASPGLLGIPLARNSAIDISL